MGILDEFEEFERVNPMGRPPWRTAAQKAATKRAKRIRRRDRDRERCQNEPEYRDRKNLIRWRSQVKKAAERYIAVWLEQ